MVSSASSESQRTNQAADPDSGSAASLLHIRDLSVQYGSAVTALAGVSLDVAAGGITAVLGGNGAGKTTLMRAISGVLSRHGGEAIAGDLVYDGRSILTLAPERRVTSGVVQVPEGRRIFGRLSVMDNLRVGRFGNPQGRRDYDVEKIFELFPALADKRRRRGAFLSGGEQQMLAIGRALMAAPRLLLLDEPTLGLAPLIVGQIVELIERIRWEGTTVLLVEQNARVALHLADYAYVFSTGRVALSGEAGVLRDDDRVRRLYLGDESGLDEED